jgi:hypothetical protein
MDEEFQLLTLHKVRFNKASGGIISGLKGPFMAEIDISPLPTTVKALITVKVGKQGSTEHG